MQQTSLLAFCLCLAVPAFAQYTSVVLQKVSSDTVVPVSISVPHDKVFGVVGFTHSENGYSGQLAIGTMVVGTSMFAKPVFGEVATNAKGAVKIAGPATLTLSLPGQQDMTVGEGCLLTYKVTDNSTSSTALSPLAGTAVVIPSDATGPVQIILESSTDLLNWATATTGSYGASTQRRFFRVRALAQ